MVLRRPADARAGRRRRLAAIDGFFDSRPVVRPARRSRAASRLPFPPGATAGDGFPLGVWETTYRGRHRAGTLDPEQAAELEALPGWRW